jgi:hypothetical protein
VTTLLAGVDQPPLQMTVSTLGQRIAELSVGGTAIVMAVAALWHWRRSGRPTGLLVLAGGLICAVNEPLIDSLGHVWYPTDGENAYTLLQRYVPWWVVFAYVAFFGGLAWLLSELIRSGGSQRTLWLAVGGVWLADVILEIPILSGNVYIYYGQQPFQIGGFPLIWAFLNCGGALLGAVAIARLSPVLTGIRQLWLLLIPIVTQYLSWFAGMPHFLALGSDTSDTVREIASAASMLITIAVIVGLIRLAVPTRTSTTTAGATASERVGLVHP